jgi:hypothetical protein
MLMLAKWCRIYTGELQVVSKVYICACYSMFPDQGMQPSVFELPLLVYVSLFTVVLNLVFGCMVER